METKASRSSMHHCMQLAGHRWCSPALLGPPHLVHSSAVSGTPAGPPNTVFSRFSASAGGRLSASSPAAVLTCGAAAGGARVCGVAEQGALWEPTASSGRRRQGLLGCPKDRCYHQQHQPRASFDFMQSDHPTFPSCYGKPSQRASTHSTHLQHELGRGAHQRGIRLRRHVAGGQLAQVLQRGFVHPALL